MKGTICPSDKGSEQRAQTEPISSLSATEMYPLPFVACFVFICSISLSNCLPSVEEKDISISSSVLSSSDGFQVSSLSETKDGECISKLVIHGHGIHKVIDYACTDKPMNIINLNKTLLLGEEYFSDTHGELVRLEGESCIKEVFTDKDGSLSSTVHLLDDLECEKIKIKIGILKEEHQSWLEWMKAKQKEAHEQFMQLQNNLAALQQNLFGGFFGGLFG